VSDLKPEAKCRGVDKYRLNQIAKAPETFNPHIISLQKEDYKNMVQRFRLPLRAIETSTVVGPFFWWTYDDDDPNDSIMRMFLGEASMKEKKTMLIILQNSCFVNPMFRGKGSREGGRLCCRIPFAPTSRLAM
jgi:hypothetical protein